MTVSRRSVLGFVAAVSAAGATPSSQPEHYGMIGSELFSDWRIPAGHCRVWVDDVELTNRCYGLDQRIGEVYCYVHGSSGRPFLRADRKDVARETIRGAIRVEFTCDCLFIHI